MLLLDANGIADVSELVCLDCMVDLIIWQMMYKSRKKVLSYQVHFPVDKVLNRLVHRKSRTILFCLARPEQERAPS